MFLQSLATWISLLLGRKVAVCQYGIFVYRPFPRNSSSRVHLNFFVERELIVLIAYYQISSRWFSIQHFPINCCCDMFWGPLGSLFNHISWRLSPLFTFHIPTQYNCRSSVGVMTERLGQQTRGRRIGQCECLLSENHKLHLSAAEALLHHIFLSVLSFLQHPATLLRRTSVPSRRVFNTPMKLGKRPVRASNCSRKG